MVTALLAILVLMLVIKIAGCSMVRPSVDNPLDSIAVAILPQASVPNLLRSGAGVNFFGCARRVGSSDGDPDQPSYFYKVSDAST